MKKALAILLIFSISSMSPYSGTQMRALTAAPPQADQEYWEVQFSAEQLENLVAPVALYPDPLLAQVLVAATFPDQIDAASNEIRSYGSGYNIDDAPWDVSVKAVAHYPTVLSMMSDKIDWTTALGQAYVSQSTDLMNAVQRLRRRARNAGNLVTTSQWQIVDTSGYLYIYPAQPEYIYVPVYDPAVVYVQRPSWYTAAIISFGAGLLIGAWLNNDCDWHNHRVYYHGWQYGYGYAPPPVWIQRSRPYVHTTNVYVNNRYRNVVVNRTVVNRDINYGSLNRYNTIHRDVDYSKVRRERGAAGHRPQPPKGAEAQRQPAIQPGSRTAPPSGTRPGVGERRVPGQERRQPQVTQPAPRVGEQRRPPQAAPRGPTTGERRVPGQEKRQPQVTQPAPRVGEQRTPPRVTPPSPTTGERRVPGQEKRQPQATQPAPRVGERQKPAQATRPAPTTSERRLPPGQEKKQPQVTQPAPAQRGNVQVPRTPAAGGQQPAQRGNVQVPRTPAQRAPEPASRGQQGRTVQSGAAGQPRQANRREQSRPAPQVRSVPQQPQPAPQVRSAPQQSRPAPQAASAPRGQGRTGQAQQGRTGQVQKGKQGDSKGDAQGQEQRRRK